MNAFDRSAIRDAPIRPRELWRLPTWDWFGGSTSILTWVRICSGDFPR